MATTKWVIDPAHSEIGFKVKHMMFTNLSGKFNDYQATIVSDENNFENATIDFSADVKSVDTGSEERDNHLRSAEFFDAENNPKITFKSSTFTKVGDGNYELTGKLKIRGVEKQVKLPVEFSGIMTDPWGNKKIGLNITEKISRKDWGLNWNSVLEAGGVLVSDDVRLNIEIQFIRQ